MKQLHITGVAVAIAAFAATLVLAHKEVQAAVTGVDKPASDAVRESGASKSGGADAKGAPPAWVVSSTGTVARAEAGDIDAMEEIAHGYKVFAREVDDYDEREAMRQEATKWMRRRAKIVVKDPGMLARAEKGDEAAMMDIATGYLFLTSATTREAQAEERKVMFKKSMEWLRRRAEKIAASGDTDAVGKVAQDFLLLSFSPEFNLEQEEQESMRGELEKWTRRRDKIAADSEGSIDSVRKRAEAGDPAAQRNLGFRYSLGVDVEKDEKKSFEWTKKAAEQGDAKAMFNLAGDYARGHGVAMDKATALVWYRKAAEALYDLVQEGGKVDPHAMVFTGKNLLDEKSLFPGAIHAPDVGMQFLGIAAMSGDVEGMRLFGEQFYVGKAVEEDFDMALLWLRRAAKRGDNQALDIIAKIHNAAFDRLFLEIHDKAEAGDKDAARKRDKITELVGKGLAGEDICWAEAQALAGYASSQAELGRAYMVGKGVSQDKKKAVELLRKAADQGEYRAISWLGIAYECGDGVAKDDWRALAMWQKSHTMGWEEATDKLLSLLQTYRAKAEKGDASAQFFVGAAFENGYSVERDPKVAVEWYRKAAKQGHPGAQAFLGWALQNGQGVEKNLAEAFSWYRKAAEQGNPEAQQNLGRCLFYGDGCKKNEQEGVSWYRKAAEQGEPGAMFNLGKCYMEGTGVKKDEGEGVKWFERAAALGHEKSRMLLSEMRSNVPEGERKPGGEKTK